MRLWESTDSSVAGHTDENICHLSGNDLDLKDAQEAIMSHSQAY